MKRYKDCTLECIKGQSPTELLDIVMRVSESKGYKIERYSSMSERDSLAVYINEKGLPFSRLIVFINTEDKSVAVINIVPMPESGTAHIEYTEYNQLLNIFRDNVFIEINKQYGNPIYETAEDYTIEEIIPLSFPALNMWLNAFPLSAHPLDTKRWNAFVVALHTNNEHLSLDDFQKYIQEKYGWKEDVIEEFSLKLESQLNLLEYYDEHR